MDGDLSNFEEKKKFKKRVHQQKSPHTPQKNPDKKIIEKLFKEVSENVCKQTWDWTEPRPGENILNETKCWD